MNTTIVEYPERHYVSVRKIITMTTFAQVADRLMEVYGWLAQRGVEPVGAPFFRFNVIDMDGQLDVEAGWEIAAPVESEGEVVAGILPGGRYASTTHIGHPDKLLGTIQALREEGLDFDMTQEEDGEHWGCRLEIYKTDPRVEPDWDKWEIELQFRLTTG